MKGVCLFVILVIWAIVPVVLSSCTLGDPLDIPNNMYYWFIPEAIRVKQKYEGYYFDINNVIVVVPDKIYLDFYSYISIANVKILKRTSNLGYLDYTSFGGLLDILVSVSIVDAFGNRKVVFEKPVMLQKGVYSTNIEVRFVVSDIEVGKHKLTVKIQSYCCNNEEKVFEREVLVLRGTKYNVWTIPITNSMNNPADTVLYLYRKERGDFSKVAEDDDSGYSNLMAKITKFLAPGEYFVKVSTHDLITSNNFAVYFGKNEIFSNTNVFIDSNLSNYSPDSATLLIEGVPTNTFLNQTIVERWFKFVVP